MTRPLATPGNGLGTTWVKYDSHRLVMAETSIFPAWISSSMILAFADGADDDHVRPRVFFRVDYCWRVAGDPVHIRAQIIGGDEHSGVIIGIHVNGRRGGITLGDAEITRAGGVLDILRPDPGRNFDGQKSGGKNRQQGNFTVSQSTHGAVGSIPCRGMDETMNFTASHPFLVAVFIGSDNSCSI